jgi:predicted transcriptional regulator of viral defense system
MRPKSALQKIKPLLNAPSFTSEQARAHDVSASTVAYYVATGDLIRIGRGIYKAKNSPKASDFQWEDLVEAQRAQGGVVCLISALALYDLTEEIPRQHWIAVLNETTRRRPGSSKIVRMRNMVLGKTTKKVGGVEIPIFDRERTIVDSFRFLSTETALKALKAGLAKRGAERINPVRLQQYAKKLRVNINPFLLAMTI